MGNPSAARAEALKQHEEALEPILLAARRGTSAGDRLPTRTGVTGVMSGTFTKPMPAPGSKSIPPTGKHFALSMVTIGHCKNSTMDHEWLFWDNQDFMNQIGLGK